MARNPPNMRSRRRESEAAQAMGQNTVARQQSRGNSDGNNPTNAITTESALSSPRTPTFRPLPNMSSRSSSPLIPSRPSYTGETSRSSGVIAALGLRNGTGPEESSDHAVQLHHQNDVARIEEQLKAFFERQEAFNKRMEELKDRENHEKTSKRIPKHVTSAVRDAYKHLLGQNGEPLEWSLKKIFSDHENREVNEMLIASVRSTDAVTPTVQIRAAMKVHFRTKKRQQKLKDENKDHLVLHAQRKRSRLNTKKVNRASALAKSTSIAEEDKALYVQCMTVAYMSSEESMSEADPLPPLDGPADTSEDDEPGPSTHKVLVRRPLKWRSEAVNNLMVMLDRKISRRKSARSASMAIKRKTGQPSDRPAPEDVVM